ncbi:MAG: DUF2059 domain-containing protein [Candidatus Latescibacteria bacterium]|nr:DUF2059 domain-containing protein [Candidatus Latescibacterota bacterium]
MKTTVLLLAAGLVFGGGVALAEQTSTRAMAEELLALMNMPQTIEQSLVAMRQMMPAQIEQMNKVMGEDKASAGVPEQTDKVMDILAEELTWDKVKDDYVGLYASTFTAEELGGLITFYKSPAGQAFVAKQPELMKHSMEIGQKLMVRLMPRLQTLHQEGKAEGVPQPADKKKSKK